jgi:ABC-type transport system involved in cytochrome bd biosynthesis fused ATPase/permease subunit
MIFSTREFDKMSLYNSMRYIVLCIFSIAFWSKTIFEFLPTFSIVLVIGVVVADLYFSLIYDEEKELDLLQSYIPEFSFTVQDIQLKRSLTVLLSSPAYIASALTCSKLLF